MRRWLRTSVLLLPLLAASQPAAAFLFVSGSGARSGDLIGVWVKNGFEWIMNLGPIDQLGQGPVTSFAVPAQFGGNLTGAKFTALAVPNPDAAYTDLGLEPPPPQPNIGLTTLGDPGVISDVQVGDAQAVLDPPLGGSTWLNNLNVIPAAGSADVIVNNDDEALISTTLFAAYTATLGFSTDAIGNTLTISTAVVIEAGVDYEIPLYEVFQTLVEDQGNFVFGTDVAQLGTFSGDSNDSGTAVLSFTAPEPSDAALGLVAFGLLASLRKRRD